MVVSIYACAILLPLAVWSVARRTGHGPGWQAVILACGAVVWMVLALGFAQEFLSLTFFSDALDRFGFLAVVALAALSVTGFWLSVKRWPRRS